MTEESTTDNNSNSYMKIVELSTQMYKNSTITQKVRRDKK